MKLTYEDHDEMTVMTLRGDLTSDEVNALRKLASDRIDHNIRDFVLDVDAMEFIDSEGLETLLWLQEVVAERLGQVRLAGMNDNLNQILEITRLSKQFDCHVDVESAIKSLR